MQILRANTEVIIRIVSFLDWTGGPLALDQCVALKHNGMATVSLQGNAWVHIENCLESYNLTLTASNTDTIGMLTVVVQSTTERCVRFKEFMVVSEKVYDSLFGAIGTDHLITDTIEAQKG